MRITGVLIAILRNLFCQHARSFEVTAEGEIQIYTFTEAGSADLSELDFRYEIFSGETEDGEHVDLALLGLLSAERHRFSTAGNYGAKRAFAFAQIVITRECIFHFLKRAQRVAYVNRGRGFLLGGTQILRSLEFTAKENRLRDPAGETPDEGIERADPVKVRGSETARGAEYKTRQTRSACLVYPVEGGGETALAGDEVRAAFEDLRRQTGRDTSRLAGKRTPHIKFAGRIATGDDLNRADCLRARRLGGIERILGGGVARCNLRHVEVTRKTLLFALLGEFRILMIDIECFLCVRFLLRGFDRSEVRARHRSGE